MASTSMASSRNAAEDSRVEWQLSSANFQVTVYIRFIHKSRLARKKTVDQRYAGMFWLRFDEELMVYLN